MNTLKQSPQWVNWRRDPEHGKIPINPRTGGNAQSNNPATWDAYKTATELYESGQYDGVGFMFSSGICGIDIDDSVGIYEREEHAKEIIALMATYTEYSPSGKGYHLIFKADISKIPKNYKAQYYQKNPHNNIECYLSGVTNRFFTYTGEAVNDWGVEDRTDQLLIFLNKYMKKKNPPTSHTSEDSTAGQYPGNDAINYADVLSIARKAKNRNKFIKLFDKGDISAYNNDDSAADQALASILAFYCNGNFTAIDQLFRQSALMRGKWEREDYRTATINNAIALCGDKFYRPPGRPRKQKPLFIDNEQTNFVTVTNLNQHLQDKGIVIRYNDINHVQDITGLDSVYGREHSQDILPVLLYDELRFIYDKVTKGDIRDFLNVIAVKNKYNPVLDALETLVWDKVDRLPELFNVLGIHESDRLSKTLIYKWLWQCLSLARNKLTDDQAAYGADGLLVLIGKQGIGKTSFFRKLAMSQDFFYEGKHLDFRDKDTLIRASSAWITELGEIESTLRSDIEKLKAFITDKTDMYRRPYGHGDLHLARHTSFCATCNNTKFLIDPTGNRRFWSVPVNQIDLGSLNDLNVTQLWAQVDELTRGNCQGFRLNQEEQAALSARNGGHEKPLKGEMEIRDILDIAGRRTDIYDFKHVTVTEFKQAHDVLRNYSVQQIAQSLDKIGIELIGLEYIDGERKRVRLLPVYNDIK